MKVLSKVIVAMAALMCSYPSYAAHSASSAPAAAKYTIDRIAGGKLYTLTGKIAVHSGPTRRSAVIGTYGKGSIFAVMGQARGTDYLYVSPCNACRNGFVRKSELLQKVKR
jgi:hypothetical protein